VLRGAFGDARHDLALGYSPDDAAAEEIRAAISSKERFGSIQPPSPTQASRAS
jgi:hypothetical protein